MNLYENSITTIPANLLFSTSCFGQGSYAGGPPTTKQLYGYWKMVNHPNIDAIQVENPWPQKYQWFALEKDGSFYSMMSDVDANHTAKDLKQIFKLLPKNQSQKYNHQGQMLYITHSIIPNYQEIWGVNLMAMDVNSFLTKGRLIMSLDDGNGNIIYYRLMERVK